MLRGESRPASSPSKRFTAATPVQPGPSHPVDDPASAGPSRHGPLLLRLSSQVLRIQKMTLHTLVHLGDGPTIPIRVRLGILLARGVILLPSRGVGSKTIRLPMRARLPHIADNRTISRMTRNIFVMLLWLFCWTTS